MSIIALLIGFFLDRIIGDPHFLPHPVRWIGSLIKKLEDKFLVYKGKEYTLGVLTVVIVTFVSTLVPFLILYILNGINIYLRLAVESIMCYQCIAAKALRVESMKVFRDIENKDLKKARTSISMIVGRDTASLDYEGIERAAVETVAENTSDGVIAPMIFMALGGAPLGFFYKAVNTMDSMIGYKNEKYMYFGRFAAKLDDVLNFIPARISAILMIISSFLLGLDFKGAFRIFKRDRFNHKSPNSAQTEAVCAGALGIRLAGDSYYFGKLAPKPTIGDDTRKVDKKDIVLSNRLMYFTQDLLMTLILLVYLLSYK